MPKNWRGRRLAGPSHNPETVLTYQPPHYSMCTDLASPFHGILRVGQVNMKSDGLTHEVYPSTAPELCRF